MASYRHRRNWRWKTAAAMLMTALLLPLPGRVSAQTPVSGFSSAGGANSKKPIDIESDRLEVDDKTHMAIFTGNVSASQGDLNLRAPRLEVTYEKAAEATPPEQGGAQGSKTAKPVKPASANANADASADPFSNGQIKFVHATGGKVVVINKVDEEEATGDDVVYDVKGQKITMTGKEVILTQKKNVVKGRQIDIDLASGRATVIPEHGRVRAILTQEDARGMSQSPLTGPKKKDAEFECGDAQAVRGIELADAKSLEQLASIWGRISSPTYRSPSFYLALRSGTFEAGSKGPWFFLINVSLARLRSGLSSARVSSPSLTLS